MGLIKKDTAQAVPEAPPVETGATAAISRLQKKSAEAAKTAAPVEVSAAKAYKPRDFDAEARGKTRCSCWGAAIASPAIAGLPFKNIDELLELVRKAAEDGVKYSFNE